MDYDRMYDADINRETFYSNYSGTKLINGKVSLKNARVRLAKNELYTLVTYGQDEELPSEYIPLSDLTIDETLFATMNPNTRINYICRDGGIQMVASLSKPGAENPEYLLGPGPGTIFLMDLVNEQYNKFFQKENVNSR